MSGSEVKYITPPVNLRQKQKLAGVTSTIDGVWLDVAEKSMGNAKFDYLEAVNEDLSRLQAAYDAARAYEKRRDAAAAGSPVQVCTIGSRNSDTSRLPLSQLVNSAAARPLAGCAYRLDCTPGPPPP